MVRSQPEISLNDRHIEINHSQHSYKRIMHESSVYSLGIALIDNSCKIVWKNVCCMEINDSCRARLLIESNYYYNHYNHDNVCPHSAKHRNEFLEQHGTTISQPHYLSNLALWDFWIFPRLDRFLLEIKFNSNFEVQQSVERYLKPFPKE